jgi:hypothetical protein
MTDISGFDRSSFDHFNQFAQACSDIVRLLDAACAAWPHRPMAGTTTQIT